MNVPIAQAKAQFSELIKRAEAGEEVLVTRHGTVVARLMPPERSVTDEPSLVGALEGRIWIAEDFDELGPEWDEYVK